MVGASAGGVEALSRLVAGLPADLPAAVFIVLHVPAQSQSALPTILGRAGALPVAHAINGMTIQPGHVYVAPPDHHLMLEPGRVRVVRGPQENRHRPAIDPLFRSAAVAYGSRVIGVILSGTLDDGSAGLIAVKARGGVAVVQDPADAVYPDMPRNAMKYTEVDYCLPIADIPPLLLQLARQRVTDRGGSVPTDMEQERQAAALDAEAMKEDNKAGVPSVYACPDCHGVLWEIEEGNLLRYRCRVGHAFSAQSLLAAHDESVEDALWAALRSLEENASLHRRLEERSRASGMQAAATRFSERATETESHARRLREILRATHGSDVGRAAGD